MNRLAVYVCGAALLAFAGVAGAVSPPVPALNWTECDDALCADALVPLDYDSPSGEKISLHLARYAVDPSGRIGTIFVNFGGPGAAGATIIRASGFGSALRAALGNRFDVIGFDPRGIGESRPQFRCFDTEGDRDAFLGMYPIFPYTDDQERPYFDAYTAMAEQCVARNQPLAAHMSTADAARDLDLLRQAVGDAKLSYLGFSYGSYLGNTYANLFPDKVRAVVIDGVINPLIWTIGRQISSDRVAVAAVFDEFIRLCDEAASEDVMLCPLSYPSGARETYDALAAELRVSPIVFPDFIYSYDFLVADTVGCMYSPEAWPYCASVLAFLASAASGEAGAVERASAARAEMLSRLRTERDDASYSNELDAMYGVMCSDTRYLDPFSAFASLAGWAEKGSIFGPAWWWGNSPCANWPLAEDRYAGPWTARTSASVLVIGNYFDPATDYAGAVAAAKWLKNARLLSYAGWGHTATMRNQCVAEYVGNYLFSGQLPSLGTVCPANPNPFLAGAAASASAGKAVRPVAGLPVLRPEM
jgi:pimeloyl-ACP methyl ester carboxylesterase